MYRKSFFFSSIICKERDVKKKNMQLNYNFHAAIEKFSRPSTIKPNSDKNWTYYYYIGAMNEAM